LQELTPAQFAILQKLVACGFRTVAFPLYASAIGVRRESFAALLVPAGEGGLRLLGDPCYLIEGNMAVKVLRGAGECFVWKGKTVDITPELLEQLRRFSEDLLAALS
jgi:hypothetical protein